MRGVSIFDAGLAALEMIDPVATRILQLVRQANDDLALLYFASEYAGLRKAADVLPKAVIPRHELKTVIRQLLVCAALVYPETVVAASLFVEQKVAERWVM